MATYLIDMETLKNHEKVIIIVFGPAKTGKSTAIMELAKRFPFEEKRDTIFPQEDSTDPMTDIVCKGHFTSQLTHKNVTLGICSFGDYKSILTDYFLPLVVKDKCDVIIVACHNYKETDGNTYNYIADISLENNYRLISTSILHDDNTWWKSAPFTPFHINGININEIFANNMINLIKSIV